MIIDLVIMSDIDPDDLARQIDQRAAARFGPEIQVGGKHVGESGTAMAQGKFDDLPTDGSRITLTTMSRPPRRTDMMIGSPATSFRPSTSSNQGAFVKSLRVLSRRHDRNSRTLNEGPGPGRSVPATRKM